MKITQCYLFLLMSVNKNEIYTKRFEFNWRLSNCSKKFALSGQFNKVVNNKVIK